MQIVIRVPSLPCTTLPKLVVNLVAHPLRISCTALSLNTYTDVVVVVVVAERALAALLSMHS